MATTYAEIFQGLQDRFTAAGIANVIKGEPQSIQSSPAVFSVFDSYEDIAPQSPVKQATWTTKHTLCIAWVNPDECEAQLHDWLDTLPAAIVDDPTLAGVVEDGTVDVLRGDGGYLTIGGNTYRIVELYSAVTVFSARA